jgi:hypothetical protein
MAQEPVDQDVYDLASEPAPRAPLPAAGTVASRTLSYRRVDPPTVSEPDVIRNLYMPLWLLGGGIVVEVVAVLLRGPDATALLSVGASVIIGTALMLAGILTAARLRGIDLGGFWTAVLKLAAISIAPSAAVTLVTPALNFIPFGFLLGWVGQFVLYFALLGALFDLDQSDTWFCVLVIFLVKVAVVVALVVVALKWA